MSPQARCVDGVLGGRGGRELGFGPRLQAGVQPDLMGERVG